ncbi:2-C-methyl-D-erythritol 4-phosphate cytidylyltransferase [Reinekea marina]|uniref:2-C-methyl-D-erythritol 4-phosphate cytidylyltransferase n=1 Tax=Reinekea marina TaxID=1310421 RepID=A0ABV7WR20_9GAMM|nr:2-C-methyl-D-erythritol 4-phosphate cytidylyltransferase [Reinekea marina]MDN3650335.1 2-C-methyl-D-erythritol 4-phosphate cytidylyltransferase [Reinekea marina]MDN3651162.1 2-C-methyl-D-erythritol 4-phosphate cytidylyltransferase [Reinekea marina]
MTVHVVFPAAGVGSRFGADIPKQYVSIAGKTVMEWTLLAWQDAPVDGLKIVVKAKEDETCTQILSKFDHAYQTVLGGHERFHSVMNALIYLRKHGKADDWVMVHDIARPCVRRDDIQKLLQSCKTENQGGVLAKPITDTVKRLQRSIVTTEDRSQLWAALTPQCFRLGELSSALEQAIAQNAHITDEASAIELAELPVQLIEGHGDNIKLTRSEDAALVQFYLSNQERIKHV